LIQALIVFAFMRRNNRVWLYPFLFVCFYCRLLAAGMSAINPNDEARISSWLGLGMYTLPMLMTISLFFLVYIISRQYHFSWKFNLATLFFTMLFSSLIILSDQFWKIVILS
jgi:hypothetical protein